MAAQTYGTKTVVTAAQKIVAANHDRVNVLISNTSSSVPLYIGPDSSVTTSNGILVPVSGTVALDNFMLGYRGDIYGITGSTADVRYWENSNKG